MELHDVVPVVLPFVDLVYAEKMEAPLMDAEAPLLGEEMGEWEGILMEEMSTIGATCGGLGL